MDETSVVAKFVSKKIHKVRWRPTSRHIVQAPTIFAAGSWDDEGESFRQSLLSGLHFEASHISNVLQICRQVASEYMKTQNELSIWCMEQQAADSIADGDGTSPSVISFEPALLGSTAHRGDVMDLLFLEQDNIVTASSLGTVFIHKYDQRSQTINLVHSFDKIHRYDGAINSCPCTAIACRGDERIATVGEDGRLNLLTLETQRSSPAKIRTIDVADSCSLNAVCFLTQSEVAAVNSTGQFKIWDTRQPNDEPAKVFVLTGDKVPLHCMDRHPTQPHIVATGGLDGTLYLWDMRQEKYPITLLEAHASSMWEVHFHPSNPSHLFSCSNDGSLFHWDSSEANSYSAGVPSSHGGSVRGSMADVSSSVVVNSWLMGDASKRHVAVKNLLPGNIFGVNSLDVAGGTLICGTDGEQIYTIRCPSLC